MSLHPKAKTSLLVSQSGGQRKNLQCYATETQIYIICLDHNINAIMSYFVPMIESYDS